MTANYIDPKINELLVKGLHNMEESKEHNIEIKEKVIVNYNQYDTFFVNLKAKNKTICCLGLHSHVMKV